MTLGAIGLIGTLSFPARANLEPDWIDDFEAKVKSWLARLEAAAKAAAEGASEALQKATEIVKARIEELREILEQQKEALTQLIEREGEAWAALLEARVSEFEAVAGEFTSQVREIAQGLRTHLTIERDRLLQGVQATLERRMGEAEVRLGDIRVVDGVLVASAVESGKLLLLRSGGAVLAAVGFLVALSPFLEAVRRRVGLWVVLVVLGLGSLGAGIWLAVTSEQRLRNEVQLGLRVCAAQDGARAFLDRFGGAPPPTERAELGRWIRELTRCRILAPDDVTAALLDKQILRLQTALVP